MRLSPVVDELGELFAHAGHDIALVGGSVRDALLGRLGNDLDFATSARPDEILRITKGWRESQWETGIAFGTVGLLKEGLRLEVTTYRFETYDAQSRKPEVTYGDSLDEDLRRRDFAVNAMAVSLPDHAFHDPFGGAGDLAARVLRTPGLPEDSFSDDPLRMMRAARFVGPASVSTSTRAVFAAIEAMADRIAKISAERVRDELSKLMTSPDPRRGLALLVDTGLADRVLPELPKLRLETDEHFRHKDVYEHTLTVVEQAMALEDGRARSGVAAGGAAARCRQARDPAQRTGRPRLVPSPRGRRREDGEGSAVGAEVSEGRRRRRCRGWSSCTCGSTVTATGEWTDSAVRRYVRDAGPLLERLHKLTRSDCTTRNKRRAAALSAAYDELEHRIEALRQQEEVDALRPELNGIEIGEVLGIAPGPTSAAPTGSC